MRAFFRLFVSRRIEKQILLLTKTNSFVQIAPQAVTTLAEIEMSIETLMHALAPIDLNNVYSDRHLARQERWKLDLPDESQARIYDEREGDDEIKPNYEDSSPLNQRLLIEEFMTKRPNELGLFCEVMTETQLSKDILEAFYNGDFCEFGRLYDVAAREYIGKSVIKDLEK